MPFEFPTFHGRTYVSRSQQSAIIDPRLMTDLIDRTDMVHLVDYPYRPYSQVYQVTPAGLKRYKKLRGHPR